MMSQYDELCKALESGRDPWRLFQQECGRFAARFYSGLVEYLEAPGGFARCFVFEVPDHPRENVVPPPSPPEFAVRFRDDGHCDFGLGFCLEARSRYHRTGFKVRFKKTGNETYFVEIDLPLKDKATTVVLADPASFELCYDRIVRTLLYGYSHPEEYFLNGGMGYSKRLGFAAPVE